MSSTRRPGYGQGGTFKRRSQDASMFWWTILITFLMVMAAGSWIFSLYLFAFPEKAFNYRLLSKLEKLEPIEDFNANTVPVGPFHDARELYEKFYHFSGEQLEGTNGKLKRSYLWNFEGQLPIYVKGTFRVAHVRKLTADDCFTSGLLLQAHPIENVENGAMSAIGSDGRRVFPNAVFEFVLPSNEVPDALFKVGQEITLNTTRDYAALLNIKRIDTDHLCFTALPLLYGTYPVDESASLSLSPPSALNIEAPWPLSKDLIKTKGGATAAGDTGELDHDV